IFDLGIPILGICYGMQLMTHVLGGEVRPSNIREYGKATIDITDRTASLFTTLEEEETVWMSHGDYVTQVPEGFHVTATNPHCPISAMQHADRPFHAVQFHPEVRHTDNGNQILKNFAFNVCECSGDWSMQHFIDVEI